MYQDITYQKTQISHLLIACSHQSSKGTGPRASRPVILTSRLFLGLAHGAYIWANYGVVVAIGGQPKKKPKFVRLVNPQGQYIRPNPRTHVCTALQTLPD